MHMGKRGLQEWGSYSKAWISLWYIGMVCGELYDKIRLDLYQLGQGHMPISTNFHNVNHFFKILFP